MDHSDRVGPLETFDLNEKLGHLHDLNDTQENFIKKISLGKSHEENLIEKMETIVYLCSPLALYYKVMKSDIDKT